MKKNLRALKAVLATLVSFFNPQFEAEVLVCTVQTMEVTVGFKDTLIVRFSFAFDKAPLSRGFTNKGTFATALLAAQRVQELTRKSSKKYVAFEVVSVHAGDAQEYAQQIRSRLARIYAFLHTIDDDHFVLPKQIAFQAIEEVILDLEMHPL